jgi:hypothetical protein
VLIARCLQVLSTTWQPTPFNVELLVVDKPPAATSPSSSSSEADSGTKPPMFESGPSPDATVAMELGEFWGHALGPGRVFVVGMRALRELYLQLPGRAPGQLQNSTAAAAKGAAQGDSDGSNSSRSSSSSSSSSTLRASQSATDAPVLQQPPGRLHFPGVSKGLEVGFVAAAASLVGWQASTKPLVPWLTQLSDAAGSGRQQSTNVASTDQPNATDAEMVAALLLKPPASADSTAAVDAAKQVITALQHLSQDLLQALPLASMSCSNPAFGNLRGSNELALVADRGLCGGCRSARYCCRACQQQDWPSHKQVCQRSPQ